MTCASILIFLAWGFAWWHSCQTIFKLKICISIDKSELKGRNFFAKSQFVYFYSSMPVKQKIQGWK